MLLIKRILKISKAPSGIAWGFCIVRIGSDFLAQLAQLLCQKFQAWLITQKLKSPKTLILQ
jgi:hypothetical protein